MLTDSYNISHWELRKDNKRDVAYMYNRNAPIILFGLAGLSNALLNQHITYENISEMNELAEKNGLEFDDKMWLRLRTEHEGKVGNVLKIEQLPEFRMYPKNTPLARISNTVDGFAEMVTYWEGFLTKAYFPSMVMTKLYEFKKAGLQNIHNFGYRGHRSEHDAMWSDLAFLMMYDGTDSFHINGYLRNSSLILQPYAHILKQLKPTTIRAASHKVIQSYATQLEAIESIIQKTAGKTVAFPIDTYDSSEFIGHYLDSCLQQACRYGTNVMFRIDSGDHIRQARQILNRIIDFKYKFALDNGFVMPRFGIIIGDDMDLATIQFIRNTLNVTYKDRINIDRYLFFGIGGNLYNDITRDQVGMVTKLAYSDSCGATMKTTKRKESYLGIVDVIYDDNKDYLVILRNNQLGLLGFFDPVDEKDWFAMRSGKARGDNAKLIIDSKLQEQMNEFVTKKVHKKE